MKTKQKSRKSIIETNDKIIITNHNCYDIETESAYDKEFDLWRIDVRLRKHGK